MPYTEPIVWSIKRPNGQSVQVCRMSIITEIERRLQHDKDFRMHSIAASDSWKRGEVNGAAAHNVPATSFSDTTDGSLFRNHPRMLRRATAAEWNRIRIAWVLYMDEFTVTHTPEPPRPPSSPPAQDQHERVPCGPRCESPSEPP